MSDSTNFTKLYQTEVWVKLPLSNGQIKPPLFDFKKHISNINVNINAHLAFI